MAPDLGMRRLSDMYSRRRMLMRYKIRLPNHQIDDFSAWHHEKTGMFTVKSAYKLGKGVVQASSSTATCGERKV